MEAPSLIPHLFRTEYRKMAAVLTKKFGFEHIEIAQDIVSETFLMASETWGLKGIPENPPAWLYTVAKNKSKDLLKRNSIFSDKVAASLKQNDSSNYQVEIDLSVQNIEDSQLQMMFAISHPCINTEAQIGLSLQILCGFGAEEIADAFLTNKDAIYKRLARAKEKLRDENVKLEMPPADQIEPRLETVLTTLYSLFSEGYYSQSKNTALRKELCIEALRLNFMLVENQKTCTPKANALLSLMCFHSSRFEARTHANGDIILYEDQDTSLWNQELIRKGEYYLNQAAKGNRLTKYHLEAGIAFWYTQKGNSAEKWKNILQYYNYLLQIEYSPIADLNRTYAFAKVEGFEKAITEALKLNLHNNHWYYTLLAHLYYKIDMKKAIENLKNGIAIAKNAHDKQILTKKLEKLTGEAGIRHFE